MRCVFLISDHAAQSIGNAGNTGDVAAGGAWQRQGCLCDSTRTLFTNDCQFSCVPLPQILPRKVCSATCATFFAFLTTTPTRNALNCPTADTSFLSSQFTVLSFDSRFSVLPQLSAPNFSLAKTTHGVKISKYANFWR